MFRKHKPFTRKVKERKAHKIRIQYLRGTTTYRKLAKKHKIGFGTVHRIITRKGTYGRN